MSEADFQAHGQDIAESLGGLDAETETKTPFNPIGFGLPLTVMIRHVYTGCFPESGFFSGGDGDVAVVSGVKDFDVFAASARALNLIAKNQKAGAHLHGPSAFSEGTTLVTYSPAVLAKSITLTVELAVATFPAAFVASVASAFSSLAGLPILMPYAGYLLGAGQLVKIGGDLGHSLLDKPVFSVTEPLNFNLPGAEPARADFRVLSKGLLQADRYDYVDGKGLIDRASRRPYDGAEPYIVISLDGAADKRLEKFAPTVASAEILQRFFQMKDNQQAVIESFVEGMRLVSDLKYRDQAVGLQAEIAAAEEGSPERKELEKRLVAVAKNISNLTLKPPGK
ncbi:hypothetical protein [Bosea caraganae]|uniref:hypothetical protein n=1 Tax=Bosea caraganae TaxID=2763117 RepID=UPI0011C07D7B|nr:hypothetical protein [Bosea caraganae]